MELKYLYDFTETRDFSFASHQLHDVDNESHRPAKISKNDCVL